MNASGSGPCDALVLLDHDNIPFQRVSLRQVLEAWCEGIPEGTMPPGIVSIVVRLYGGWFRETQTSPECFKASEFYQNECPAMVKVRDRYWRIQFEFADKLLMPPSAEQDQVRPSITHTVAVARQPKNSLGAVECRLAQRWIVNSSR